MFVATCPPGLEAALATELHGLGVSPAEPRRSAVPFGRSSADAYRALVFARTASRVLAPLATFPARAADDLYAGAASVPWESHLDPTRTFAVTVVGGTPAGDDRRFLALRTKDAVADRLRDRLGRRPDVDRHAPDLPLHVFLDGEQATVSVDLSGEPLHRRGDARRLGGAAPLKENLAAALLLLVDWPARAARGEPIVDPTCGSGTFLLEAARMARDVAPGLGRARWGVEGWLRHEPALLRAALDEAAARRDAAAHHPLAAFGYDASPEAAARARRNLAAAGFPGVAVEVRALADLDPPAPGPGLVVANPPYGERLGEEAALTALYAALGDVLRRRFLGWTAAVLTASPRLAKAIGLRAARRHAVLHGGLDARWLEIPIAAEAPRGEGPGWRRPSEDAPMLANRLRKNLRRLRPWAEREGVGCYRVYDRDVPEYAITIDRYEGEALVQEWAPPRHVDVGRAERRRRDALVVVPEVLGLPEDAVHLVTRARGRAQYGKRAETGRRLEVHEAGLRFLVNLDDYLDSGLFLDHRDVRAALRAAARGADFLNLFAYTCTATVYAAAGGARTTTSVDLSRTYLDWGRDNLALNGLDGPAHGFVRADVLAFLVRGGPTYDLVFCGPPTRSRSKGMDESFDLVRDHAALLEAVAPRLARGGRVLFSAPTRGFELDPRVGRTFAVEEATEALTPFDFRKARDVPRTWWLTR